MEDKDRNEEFDDDIPVGRILSRREAIALLGGTGAASFMMLAGCGGGSTTPPISTPTPTPSGSTPTPTPTPTATPTPSPTPTTIAGCVVSPVETIGPYFVEEKLNRSDIRSDPTTGTVQSGIPLSLTLYVANASGACGAISGATVDIWHCNASGLYSDEAANSTSGQKFLRGYQTTDSSGMVQFTTIYPGWYSGRTVHIHVRVRFTSGGKSYDFISQLYFNDSLTDTVLAQFPYSNRGTRDTRNSNDTIYSSQMQMTLTGSTSGYATTFVIGIA